MKKLLIPVLLTLVFVVFVMVLVKGLSNEDDWICDNGEWVKHGVPSAPKPTESCPGATEAITETGAIETIKEIKEETAEVNNGEKFSISLESNPTTGYSWEVDFDSTAIELIDNKYTSDSQEEVVGAGGTETFEFLALQSGETQITFSYLRPWEKDKEPIETKVYNISIK